MNTIRHLIVYKVICFNSTIKYRMKREHNVGSQATSIKFIIYSARENAFFLLSIMNTKVDDK